MKRRFFRIKTSEREIKDLFTAWVAISLAFSILLLRGQSSLLSSSLLLSLILNFAISGIAVGLGFVFHELAHKIVAEYYGCFAEFRAAHKMLWFAVIFAFFGFVFIAPGAVVISGHLGRRRNGLISIAGPAANMAIALLFLVAAKVFTFTSPAMLLMLRYGFRINGWLALFNLIPVFVLDGKKIFDWNKKVWAAAALIAVVLVFFV